MATTSQDTGGLGLLQLLGALGVPPQALLAMALRMSQAPVETGGTNEAPDPTANFVDEGVPGNAPGSLTAALAGGRQGLANQAAQAVGLPGQVGSLAGKAVGFGANVLGVPSGVVSLVNMLGGAATKAAMHNMQLAGRRVAPITFNGPRTIIDTPPPDATFNDPANVDTGLSLGLGPAPTANEVSLSLGLGPAPTELTIADLTPAEQAVIDAIDAAANALGEPSGGPGGPAGSAGDNGGPSSGEGGSTGTGGAPGDGGSGIGDF